MAGKSYLMSIDSALFEKTSSDCIESGLSTEVGHEVQESRNQAASLLSTGVVTSSGSNDVRNRSGERSSHGASSGQEEAVEDPPEARKEACAQPNLPHSPLHKNDKVLQASPSHCNTGTAPSSEKPLLEPATNLSGKCTMASYSPDGDPVSPGDENLPMVSPMLSAHDHAARFSFDGSTASGGGANAVDTPEKERRLNFSKTELVGTQQDSCGQTYKSLLRVRWESIMLERDAEAVRDKEEVEFELLKVKQQLEVDMREKNSLMTELSECKIEVESLRQCKASLEKEREKIKCLEDKLEEEKLKRLQAELELAKMKEENVVLKANQERDVAKAKHGSLEGD